MAKIVTPFQRIMDLWITYSIRITRWQQVQILTNFCHCLLIVNFLTDQSFCTLRSNGYGSNGVSSNVGSSIKVEIGIPPRLRLADTAPPISSCLYLCFCVCVVFARATVGRSSARSPAPRNYPPPGTQRAFTLPNAARHYHSVSPRTFQFPPTVDLKSNEPLIARRRS